MIFLCFQKGSILVKNCIFSCNASASYAGEVTTLYPDEDSSDFNGDSDYYDSGDGPVILDGQGLVSVNLITNILISLSSW